ncbi:MAG TPA: DNA-3-methyladenine glycosylase [Gammaproteobacteria bacterium]|jgi:DNA-3-methyladenine glycosylase|nr:DNA-3-methyladenine glycosylase [Gammaproteobacteria bacterium]
MKVLPRSFYDRDTIVVAKDLLGKYLVHEVNGIQYIGKVVEVEAYVGAHDLASHSSKGVTKRTAVMYGPPGHAYVYMIYGMYYCMNVVTEKEGHGSAILLRALEPIQNIEKNTKGPGLLCQAMHINKTLNQCDLLSDFFYFREPLKKETIHIIKRPRIGVHYAKDWAKKHLRFYIKGNPYVSRP